MQQQRSENINISRQALFSLVGALTGYPNPDDSNEPRGPWGPVIRQARDKLHVMGLQPEPWRAVTLNPQPLPPRWAAASALAEVILDRVDHLEMLAAALPKEAGASLRAYGSDMIRRFVDDYCGNGIIVIHLPKHGPFPPGGDEPQPIGPLELLVVGMKFTGAAELSGDVSAAGEKLIEVGLQRMQGQG
ncbi:hypothetical protein FNU79_11580 [Deinococcus detaillensis]|uniref:Uncharacterized protein n=1 Tax=Deinococcus detaillensis TaxID=2592048 RepID=A0A553UUG7_9DEIO|nr:hypothetical protein [Deinococcus detaillensis]TSA83859.1 hypothetical protein FNU79_11580 [Deinococcus detaillensis]